MRFACLRTRSSSGWARRFKPRRASDARPGEVQPGPLAQPRGAGLLPSVLQRWRIGDGGSEPREPPGRQDRVVGIRILPHHAPVQPRRGVGLLQLLGRAGLPVGRRRPVGAAPAGEVVETRFRRRVVGRQVVHPSQAPRRVVAETAEAMLLGEELPVGADRGLAPAHGFMDAADDVDGEAPAEMPGILFPERAQGLQGSRVVVAVPLDDGDPRERRAGPGALRIVPDVPAEDPLLLVPQPHLAVDFGEPFQRQPAEVGLAKDAPVEVGGRGVVPLAPKLPGFPQHGLAAAKPQPFRVVSPQFPDPFPGTAGPCRPRRPPARLLVIPVRFAVLAQRLVGLAEVVGGPGPRLSSGRRLLERRGAPDGCFVALPGQVDLDEREGGFGGPDAPGV